MSAIGRLRERVTLQAPTRRPDGQGGFIDGWRDEATVWAEVRALQGQEAIEVGALTGVQAYRVRLRAREIRLAWRLRWRGLTMMIRTAADPDGTRRFVEILAEALRDGA